MLDFIKLLSDYILFISCFLILIGTIVLSIKLRFVQLRLLPSLFKMLKESYINRKEKEAKHTILPHKALFTAMSTTLGIGTIVAPIIAVNLGGPGALLGFLFTSFFGSAATYAEVNLSIKHRLKLPDGSYMGGPMQYLKAIISPAAAQWYAIFCFLLMISWSGAQSNQVAAILDSPLLGDYRIPKVVSGLVISGLVIFLLFGGIKKIGSFSAKLVPTMFALYLGSNFWIILSNLDKLGAIFSEIFSTALSPYELATGAVVGGIANAMRWGVFKGIQANEAGIGTQAIPHSTAQTDDPHAQGTLAMLSTFSAGLIAFLSGCVTLITRSFENPDLPLGISMVASSFEMYFSSFGIVIVAIATLLFGFGTILGNSYNGSQCFNFLTNNKWSKLYFIATGLIVFSGAISEVKTFWALTDIIIALMATLHMAGLLMHAFKQQEVRTEVPSGY